MRLVLAFAAFMTAVPAFAGPASDAVKFFYAPDAYVADEAYRDRFADPALQKFKENDAMPGDGVGCIDFALQYDAQDVDDAEVAKTLKLQERVEGDHATVTATFDLFPTGEDVDRKIVWSLDKVGSGWKIADIASGKGDWQLSTFDCSGE